MDVATLAGVQKNSKIPELRPGDTVKVHVKVVEGDKERIQVFQGVVIAVKRGPTGSFTVRRVAYGVGTERLFPFNSPMVDKVEVVRHGKVRRAKLFYLRGLTAKKARLKERREEVSAVVPSVITETAGVAEVADASSTASVSPTQPETGSTAVQDKSK